MWLIALIITLSVMVAAAVIGLHVQEKNRRREQGTQFDAPNNLPPIVYTLRNTPENHDRPSFADHCKAGQRPFGEDAMTRRSERNREHAKHDYFW